MDVPAADPTGSTDYDELPYISLPVAYTQPAHLAAVALLNGVELPAAENARVLELGCATGGNIIPLAARFPDAIFRGIDLSRRHVDEARARIDSLGLGNIEILQADLATVSLGTQQYDYVICHGVFSWVPSAAREAILRLCDRHLAPSGAAVISYNVLPGWHLRGAVRDVCQRFAGRERSPAERVRRARIALSKIACASPTKTPYGQMLRAEAARTAKLPSSYILGEFLAAHNDPMHFHDFVAMAGRYNHAFLCEATPGASAAAKRPETSAAQAADIEQYADYVTGRPFRRSMLVRATGAAHSRTLSPANLHRLHISAKRHAEGDAANAGGEAMASKDATAAWILAQLAAGEPASLTPNQLAARSAAEGLISQDDGTATIHECLFRLVLADAVGISTLPSMGGPATVERPCLWKVALAESALGQPWLTSLTHDAVPLPREWRSLARYIDGRHSVTELRALLASTLGVADMQSAAQLADAVTQMIDDLARNALLAPDGA